MAPRVGGDAAPIVHVAADGTARMGSAKVQITPFGVTATDVVLE